MCQELATYMPNVDITLQSPFRDPYHSFIFTLEKSKLQYIHYTV
jgi:hypothetical protein